MILELKLATVVGARTSLVALLEIRNFLVSANHFLLLLQSFMLVKSYVQRSGAVEAAAASGYKSHLPAN